MKAACEQQAVLGEPGRGTGISVHSLPNKGIIRKPLAQLSSSMFMTSFSSSQVTNWTGTGFCLGAKPLFEFFLLYLNSCPNIIKKKKIEEGIYLHNQLSLLSPCNEHHSKIIKGHPFDRVYFCKINAAL